MVRDTTVVLPDKWRNRFFKFVAGGYDGCVWHVAFVLIDKDGHTFWVGGNDGAGKVTDLADALEREFVRHEEVSWDHEFEEHSIAKPEDVTALCKYLAKTYKDVSVQASVANMLTWAGYGDGAGCVCSDCGKFFESSEYAYFDGDDACGGFSNCIDHESYCGCGGCAVDMTRIVCDECRNVSECPACNELRLPTSRELGDKQYLKEEDFAKKFAREAFGICECCWERVAYAHDGRWNQVSQEWELEPSFTWRHVKTDCGWARQEVARLPNGIKFEHLVEALEPTQDRKTERWNQKTLSELRRYAKWQRDEGVAKEEIRAAIVRQLVMESDDDTNLLMRVPSKFAYGIVRNLVGPLVHEYFGTGLQEFEPDNIEEYWKEIEDGE